ncbi:hypothetical protein BX666DRAFT_1875911 [Dichotomocladium elegans]|nr:hypothetical protein BX666DRAFT_1875911 [Dichotomocladium elegans]
MSSNPHNQAAPSSSSTSNRWLSNILRPRASSVTVESCLNLQNSDPTVPLDARTVVSLVSSTLPLSARCKHLRTFSDLCRSYKFTHLDNVFFAVKDILEPTASREARHCVFEFMIACIDGQYDELGMARVTFYNSMRDYDNWEDFSDLYRVVFSLCKGGRDISGFEKNIGKLLIQWLAVSLKQAPATNVRTMLKSRQLSSPQQGSMIPYLSDILHLLTMIAKFNFAMFEESEVTRMIEAARMALFSSGHPKDIKTCLAFADVVVRYRFVPFDALVPFLDILCATAMLPDRMIPDKAESPWSILTNLLRSHCAHNAILTLCKMITNSTTSGADPINLTDGAITILSETAWGSKVKLKNMTELYQVPDAVILMYLRRSTLQNDDLVAAKILKSLKMLIEDEETTVALLEWDIIWDICDIVTRKLLSIDLPDQDKQVLGWFPIIGNDDGSGTGMVHEFVRFLSSVYAKYVQGLYAGPTHRMMTVLYSLRRYLSADAANALLTYYESEHMFLPSTDDWIEYLSDVVRTFFIPTTIDRKVRLRVLSIVTDVCTAIRDVYSSEMNREIVLPMVAGVDEEMDSVIRQKAVDLIVIALADCDEEAVFDCLLDTLRTCTQCKCAEPNTLEANTVGERRVSALRRSQSQSQPSPRERLSPAAEQIPRSSTATPIVSSSPVIPIDINHCCTGVPAMCGLVELFEKYLLGTDIRACARVFNTLTDLASAAADFQCPLGGSQIIAFDILLRLRCSPDHRIYVKHDDLGDECNNVIMLARRIKDIKRQERINRSETGMLGSGPRNIKDDIRPPLPSPLMVSYVEGADGTDEKILPIDDMLDAYITILSRSPTWDPVIYVLKRLPRQLSNKHMFCGASKTIEKLRKQLVTWITTKKFLDNVVNLPVSIKRNDLVVHAYNIMVVLISYRRLFKKQNQDEIVFAFYIGLNQVTAATKPCINALTVCCHELPLSVTKMLNEILHCMSKIISYSNVSVHILEFLSGLARLPMLYANFTSDMYKPVFAIALNYLQHTQSQAAVSPSVAAPIITTGTGGSTPTTPQQSAHREPPSLMAGTHTVSQRALSQYVLIMAYLVITVWFTAVPLRERRKHVSFIIQRLLSANPVGRPIDEQTFTCIDMLSRFSFADVSLAPEKSLVSRILMGDPATGPNPTGVNSAMGDVRLSARTWVYGHTLLTLKTAKALGWVEVTIRRPSGTVSMMCNIENRIKSGAIDYKTLPAFLMMQYTPDLMASQMLTQGETEAAAPPGSGLGIIFEDETAEGEESATPAAAAAAVAVTDSSTTAAPEMAEGQPPPTRSPVESGSGTPASPERERIIRQVLSEPTGDTPSQSSSVNHLRRTEQSLDPGFLYLQLSNYPDMVRAMEMVPPLPDDDATARSIANLDRIPVVDFHKIGVLYVGKGQRTEVEILANTHGSPDYVKFLNSLGNIEPLQGRIDNTGGLDREMNIDGKYAYFWRDDVTQMIFHVATMMPTNLQHDPQCSLKKRHIGNDYVSIVYNDSGGDYAFGTLPGQFNFINIVVTPHSVSNEQPALVQNSASRSRPIAGQENTFFKVEMQRRPDMPEIGPIIEPKLVSGQSLPGFVRQIALHANIFAQVFQSGISGRHEYLSHWRERLRQIRRIRDRVAKPVPVAAASASAASASAAASAGASNSGANITNTTNAASAATVTPTSIPAELLLDFTRFT